MISPGYILALLLTVGFTLGTWLQPVAANWNESRARSGNLLNIIMGDARRMFANHFFMKADAYFHSGYYPSIFDQGAKKEIHIAEQAGTDTHDAHDDHNPAHGEPGHVHDEHEGHGHDQPPATAEAGHVHSESCQHEEHEHVFLKPPRDWIEAFGRNFFNTEHTELNGAGANEILPWLRISAELDPQRVDTYTVAAFWLRGTMKRPKDAEEFLHDGQRANPDSWEIPFELGRLYRDNFKDNFRARNLFVLAARKLAAQEKQSGVPDLLAKREILISLSRLEEKEGHIPESIRYIQELHDAFPPDQTDIRKELEKQIGDLRQLLPK